MVSFTQIAPVANISARLRPVYSRGLYQQSKDQQVLRFTSWFTLANSCRRRLSRTESNKITWRMLLDAEWKR
jgi:hypothetical protein